MLKKHRADPTGAIDKGVSQNQFQDPFASLSKINLSKGPNQY